MPTTTRPSLLTKERWRLAHHSFVYDEGKVDVAQMRHDAEARLVDRRKREDTVIHFHEYNENGGCPEDSRHEYYLVPD
jgi:hypothetical protein